VAVSAGDLARMAGLARLRLSPAQTGAMLSDLNSILEHMETLAAIDTSGVETGVGIGAEGLPLRSDDGPPVPLARPATDLAPESRDGFLIVPRLSTHRRQSAG
jgi:aspartyl-tRNA(Asn)/glutamyl-tRNA(Gln) amidotransferase subunit C